MADVGHHRFQLLAGTLHRIEVDPDDLEPPAAIRLRRLAGAIQFRRHTVEHQLAQNTTRTTFPFESARLNGLPSMSVPSIAGAGLPTVSSRFSRRRQELFDGRTAGVPSSICRALRALSNRAP